MRELLEYVGKKYNQKFPNVLCAYIGNKLEVGIYNYKHVERILTSTKFITKSSLYNFLGDVLGNGLLFSTNQKWFERRKIITPTFHFKILGQFFEVFQKQSENLCKELEDQADGRIFDITPYINMTVLKSLCGKLCTGFQSLSYDIFWQWFSKFAPRCAPFTKSIYAQEIRPSKP